MNRIKLILTAFAVLAFALLAACNGGEVRDSNNQTSADRSASSAPVEEVDVRLDDFLDPSDYSSGVPTGWDHADDDDHVDHGTLTEDKLVSDTTGPATPPLGVGSFLFEWENRPNDGLAVRYLHPDTVGLRLDKLTELSFWTYTADNGQPPRTVTLQIPFTTDVTQPYPGYQGRLTFVNSKNTEGKSVQKGQWQKWDILNNGKAYSTAGLLPGSGSPADSGYHTIDEILGEYPDAGFNSSFGSFVLKAGSGYTNFKGNADAVTLGFERQGQDFHKTFDLEPAGPESKDDCKQSGWQDFGDYFANQGDCVSFVNHNDGQGSDDQNANGGNAGGNGNGPGN